MARVESWAFWLEGDGRGTAILIDKKKHLKTAQETITLHTSGIQVYLTPYITANPRPLNPMYLKKVPFIGAPGFARNVLA